MVRAYPNGEQGAMAVSPYLQTLINGSRPTKNKHSSLLILSMYYKTFTDVKMFIAE